jgi:hypothetical protein
VKVYGRLAPDDAGLAAAADALDLSIKREVFGIALVRRLRRACCGRRVEWICRVCSRMADVTVPVSAVPRNGVGAPGQSQKDRRKGQLAHRVRVHRPGRHARSSDSTYIVIADKHSATPTQNIGEWWMRRQSRGGAAGFI